MIVVVTDDGIDNVVAQGRRVAFFEYILLERLDRIRCCRFVDYQPIHTVSAGSHPKHVVAVGKDRIDGRNIDLPCRIATGLQCEKTVARLVVIVDALPVGSDPQFVARSTDYRID